jgi:endonuclease/exonuclease/phosphatase family metal-dependent hydrolase
MDIKVVTFNGRVDVPVDQNNAWKYRVKGILEFIQEEQPDIIGMQEMLPHMVLDLLNELTGYEAIGETRQPNNEAVPIFYWKNKVKLLHTKTYWLSETPDIPFTKDPSAACVRVATTALFSIGQQSVLVVNTHLDNESETAREKGMQVILSRLSETNRRPVIIMGDFNANPQELLHQHLIKRRFRSVFEHMNLPKLQTFHGFGSINEEHPIDYIYTSNQFVVLSSKIECKKYNNSFLSDHYPIVSIVRLYEGEKL